MKSLLLSGLVALATFALIRAAAPAPAIGCNDLREMMDGILQQMIKVGPNSDNKDLNDFINILIAADKASKLSPDGFISGDLLKNFTIKGLEAIGAATNTSKQNMDVMKMLISQSDQNNSSRNTDSIVMMLGQATCYLGDRTPESFKRIYEMFIIYKPKESAVGKKANTVTLGGAAKPAIKPAKQAIKPAKPAITPAKPAITPAKPAITPAKPAITPAKPAITPAKQAITPAKPAITPAKPAITPAKPAPPAVKSVTPPKAANAATKLG